MRSKSALLAGISSAIVLGACGGGDDSGDSDIAGCLEDAGLVVAVTDVNGLEPNQVAAGQESAIQTSSPDDPTSVGEISIFATDGDAEAWLTKQKDNTGFVSEVYGRVGLTTFEDDVAREDLTACAEASV